MSPGYRSLLEIGLGGLVLGGLLAFVFFAPRFYFWSWLLVSFLVLLALWMRCCWRDKKQ